MSHRFNDLIELDGDNKLRPIISTIKIGGNYIVDVGWPTFASWIIFITFYNSESSVAVGRIGFYCGKTTGTRYYYNVITNESRRIAGWRDSSNNLNPFFEYMMDNHQEVAEWLLWYL